MKALLLLSVAFLAACSGSSAPRPLFVDTDERRELSADEQERAAREALEDIQKRIERGDLPKILFEFDRDEITPESAPTLDMVSSVIVRNDKLKVIILAHTDSIGTEEYNQDLSERRARSVKTALAKRGVPPPSMRFMGFGFSRPIADNSTDAGRAKNRRVEFRVNGRDWPAVY
jgi:outer membrane protein OmpA-like peptidoglycan-associated protein